MATDGHPDGVYTTVVENPTTGTTITATVLIIPG